MPERLNLADIADYIDGKRDSIRREESVILNPRNFVIGADGRVFIGTKISYISFATPVFPSGVDSK